MKKLDSYYFTFIGLFWVVLLFVNFSQAQIISTVAGSDKIGDGGSATGVGMCPYGVAVDASGCIYIADQYNQRIRKVTPNGIISTVAGKGTGGFSGDGGAAIDAELHNPTGVVVDAMGNLFVADRDNQRIRKISNKGIISTVAGNGVYGYSGDGDTATHARLGSPTGIAVDALGNIFIADYDEKRIRKVSVGGVITTVAGNGTFGFSGDGGNATLAQLGNPTGVAVDADGNLYIADKNTQRVRKVSSNGIIVTIAGNGIYGFSNGGGQAASDKLFNPAGVAIDAAGNLYIADYANQLVRKVSKDGSIITVAGSGSLGFSGDGGKATDAKLGYPWGVAVDGPGNIYIADYANLRIRKVNNKGIISTVAGNGTYRFSGDGIVATSAELSEPNGVAVDVYGNIYIADFANQRVRKVSINGVITTVAGNGIEGFSGDGGIATEAKLGYPTGVAVDTALNIFIVDYANQRIRKVSSNGIISTVAGNGSYGYSGDGGEAIDAKLGSPIGLAVDGHGNIFIADQDNHCIRKVSVNGIISTIAGNGIAGFSGDGGLATEAKLGSPTGIAVDVYGNIYVADNINLRIRKVSMNGTISTVAGDGNFGSTVDGGLATAAKLGNLSGVAVDVFGNIYIADQDNQNIRKVSTNGIISTVKGSETYGLKSKGVARNDDMLSSPMGVAVDASGNIYIGDSYNNRVRTVTYATPLIGSFKPTLASTGTTIIIRGSSFSNASAVSFGGVAATSFRVVSTSTIIAVVPYNAISGSVSVATTVGSSSLRGFVVCTNISPIVTIVTSDSSVCLGKRVTLMANAMYGGIAPVYQWYNGGKIIDGATSNMYHYVPSNGDIITCNLTSLNACQNINTVTSNYITETVIPAVKPSVSLSALPFGFVCYGSKVVFKATPTNGGNNPTYNFKINDISVQNDSSDTYITSSLKKGDKVTCEIISNHICQTENSAVSGSIAMDVGSNQSPSISIAVGPENESIDSDMTFRAITANVGTAPVYSWNKNGVSISGVSGNVCKVSGFVKGDKITCMVLSNNPCQAGGIATSNAITIGSGFKNKISDGE